MGGPFFLGQGLKEVHWSLSQPLYLGWCRPLRELLGPGKMFEACQIEAGRQLARLSLTTGKQRRGTPTRFLLG